MAAEGKLRADCATGAEGAASTYCSSESEGCGGAAGSAGSEGGALSQDTKKVVRADGLNGSKHVAYFLAGAG